MNSVLLVFGTTDGHTAKVANAMAATLRAQGCLVDVAAARDAADMSPTAYDAVIVAASVHAKGYQKPVIRWIRRHSLALATRPTAFVSVCLAVLETRPETRSAIDRILKDFQRSTGWTPGRVKVIAGALPWTRYGWLKKRIMLRIVRKVSRDTDTTRDYEYTDWEELRSFTREFAERYELAAVPAASV